MADDASNGNGDNVVPLDEARRPRGKRKRKGKPVKPPTPQGPCYTVTDDDGDEVAVSNFRALLLATYDLPDGQRVYRVRLRTADGDSEPIDLDGHTLATTTRLNGKIGSYGGAGVARWIGTDRQIKILCDDLAGQEPHQPRAWRVEHYGRTVLREQPVWVFGNVAMRRGEETEPNAHGIFQFSDGVSVAIADWFGDDDGGVPSAPRLDDLIPMLALDALADVVAAVDDAWGNAGLLALGWSWAVQYRDELMEAFRLFPYLYLHGATGGGKTTLARVVGALWYGKTALPDVDLPGRGPSLGTWRGFERTMATEIVAMVDEAGPAKLKGAIDAMKRIATGSGGRRARRNDKADTRSIDPRAGIILTANGRVDDEEAFLRRCVVLSMPRLREVTDEQLQARDVAVDHAYRMSSHLRVILTRSTTPDADPARDRFVPASVFVGAVHKRVRAIGESLASNDQVALAYVIAETALRHLLLFAGMLDNDPESTVRYNRDRMGKFHRWVEDLIVAESSARASSNLAGRFFRDLESALGNPHLSHLRRHVWARSIVEDDAGSATGGEVFVRLDQAGAIMRERRIGNWTAEWSHLRDELEGVPYLGLQDQRAKPPGRGGVNLAPVRGVWSFKLSADVPESLLALADAVNKGTNSEDGERGNQRGF